MESQLTDNGEGSTRDSNGGSLNTSDHSTTEENVQTPVKKLKSIFTDIITVIVGEAQEQVEFAVHRHIICRHSAFFKAACSTQWAEGLANKVELPQMSPTAFELYLKWVYSSMSDLMIAVHEHWEASPEFLQQDSTHQRGTISMCLVQMWMLADYLDDNVCKGRIIECLFLEDKAHRIPPMVDEQYKPFYAMVYSETTPGSQIRWWLVRHIIPHLDPQTFDSIAKAFPQEMVADLCKALIDPRVKVERKDSLKVSVAELFKLSK